MIANEVHIMQGDVRSKNQTIRDRSSIYFKTPSDWAKNNLLYMDMYGHFYCLKQYRVERDPFDSYLLILTLNGSGIIITNSGESICSKHDIALIDCNHKHTYYANESWEFLWLHFNGKSAKELFSLICEKLGNVACIESSHLLTYYFSLLVKTNFGPSISDEVMVSSYIHRLLADLLASAAAKKKRVQRPHLINTAIEYIEQNYNKPLNIDGIANHLKMSKSSFCHTFKEKTGFSPYDFLINTRINKAKYLLKTTNKTVNEIAWEVGFNSSANFIKTFHKKVNITPKMFRKLNS